MNYLIIQECKKIADKCKKIEQKDKSHEKCIQEM
jgi:hypothetical protein